jgi:hypothetical protein
VFNVHCSIVICAKGDIKNLALSTNDNRTVNIEH